MRAFEKLIDPLLSYTRDVFTELTPEKLASVRLTYEIIREAIADLHGTNLKNKHDALTYFKGDLFKQHCEAVGINETTLLYIANNPHKYLSKIGSYDNYNSNECTYESHNQL